MSDELGRVVAHGFVSYEDYVLKDETGRYESMHSGILSPAISLNPKYADDNNWWTRWRALNRLATWLKETYTTMPRRAIEWVAKHDDDAEMRRIASVILEQFDADPTTNFLE